MSNTPPLEQLPSRCMGCNRWFAHGVTLNWWGNRWAQTPDEEKRLVRSGRCDQCEWFNNKLFIADDVENWAGQRFPLLKEHQLFFMVLMAAFKLGWVAKPRHICDLSPTPPPVGDRRILTQQLKPFWSFAGHKGWIPKEDSFSLARKIKSDPKYGICKICGGNEINIGSELEPVFQCPHLDPSDKDTKQCCNHCGHFSIALYEWSACPVCLEVPAPLQPIHQQTIASNGRPGSSQHEHQQGPFALGREGSRVEEARRERMRELLFPVARA
ncbi:hypothetical protein T439DRAFT_374485 [Meredithblackwellia eburnea MCA 4105]